MGKLNYGSTGISYECKKVDIATGGAPRCPRCQDRVYFNEEKKALGKSWHTRCFTCAKCKKSLSSTNCANHEEEIYCSTCHRKAFGPKGYGFAGGAAGLSTETERKPRVYHSRESTTPAPQPQPQPRTQSQSPPPMSQTLTETVEHPAVSSDTFSSSSLTSRAVPAGPAGSFSASWETSNGSASGTAPPPMPSYQPSAATVQRFANLSKGDCCPRCNKRVYFAEEVNMGLKKWHKLCFKCESCNCLLEPSRCNEHDDTIYCKSCYGKKFGPKGYGFSGGAATLMSSEAPNPLANRTNLPSSSHITRETKTSPINGSQEWTEPVRI